ncbi:TetR/AcrR family transcriptional regulator [Crossiella sp. SN42]|uniref:TetR/AcrR family transcriptional regulator n=1 Tax=Crossiella sp. SN42 TaxID=2944808 RepID=UPI00207CAE7B|nr:TetR/AcrR family transcriptional regulator [Crossiella sp. SN42]MCO1582109.1 TetR/AcrR family transcriptional regulator [Crossiella sp. SN42]
MSLERPLRADAERTHQAILRVADHMLSVDPTTTLQQIADAAGVARTTVHRRFATREALVAAMIDAIMTQVEDAINAARTDTAPPLVALHQLTANLVTVKSVWRFTPSKQALAESTASATEVRVRQKSQALFDRVLAAGLVDESVSRDWLGRVYHALLLEAVHEHVEQRTDVDVLADRVVTTLFHGLGPRG